MINKTTIKSFLLKNQRPLFLVVIILMLLLILALVNPINIKKEGVKFKLNPIKSNEIVNKNENKVEDVQKEIPIDLSSKEYNKLKNYMPSSQSFYLAYTNDKSLFFSSGSKKLKEIPIPDEIIDKKYTDLKVQILDEYNEKLLITLNYYEKKTVYDPYNEDDSGRENNYRVSADLYLVTPNIDNIFHKIAHFDSDPKLLEVSHVYTDITKFFTASFYGDNQILVSDYDGLSVYDFYGKKFLTIEKQDSSKVDALGPYIEVVDRKDSNILYMSTQSYESSAGEGSNVKVYDFKTNKHYIIPYRHYFSNWGPSLAILGLIDDDKVLVQEITSPDESQYNLRNELIIYNFKNSKVEKKINIDGYAHARLIISNYPSIKLSLDKLLEQNERVPLYLDININSKQIKELYSDEDPKNGYGYQNGNYYQDVPLKVDCDVRKHHLRYFLNKKGGEETILELDILVNDKRTLCGALFKLKDKETTSDESQLLKDGCPVSYTLPTQKKLVYQDESNPKYNTYGKWRNDGSYSAHLLDFFGYPTQLNLMWIVGEGGTDNVEKVVAIACTPNTLGYKTDDYLVKNLKNSLTVYNDFTNADRKTMSPTTIEILNVNKLSKWNNNVFNIKTKNGYGDNYSYESETVIFATKDYLYEVKVRGSSKDIELEKEAQMIFNSLKFEK